MIYLKVTRVEALKDVNPFNSISTIILEKEFIAVNP